MGAYLAVQNSTKIEKLRHELTVHLVHALRIAEAFERVDPADVAHRGIDALDMELILQTNRKAVQRAGNFASCCQIFVQLLSPLQSLVEEDFMEAVVLKRKARAWSEFLRAAHTFCRPRLQHGPTHNLMSNGRCFAEGAHYLHGAALAPRNLRDERNAVLPDDRNVLAAEKLLDEWPR